MSADHETTKFFGFPLQWDKYPTDRDMLRAVIMDIDRKLKGVSDAAGNSSDGISYQDPDGNDITLTEALDRLYALCGAVEIVVNATAQAVTGEILWTYAATEDYLLPANLDGSTVVLLPLYPLDMSLRLEKNGTFIGSIVFDQSAPTIDFPDPVELARGDVLTITSNDSVTFRAISVTLRALKP